MKTTLVLVGALLIAGSAFANDYGSSNTSLPATVDRHAGAVTSDMSAATSPAQTALLKLKEGVDYQVITFARGSSDLSNAQKQAIRALHLSAKGGIDEIHVAVWSDLAFPKDAKTDLPKAQRDLADRRGDAIENFLRYDLKENATNMSDYNMAERSNWFARAFNTDEGELKSLFSQQGAPSKVDPAEFNIVRTKGGPMKAVILIEREEPRPSDLTPSNR